MQNLKVKMLSVAIAALTAATPILSSYVAYASDITVNDDGTVTQISTSTDEKVVSNPKSYTDNGYTIVKTEYKYKIKSSDNEIVDTKWTNSKTSPSGYVYANVKPQVPYLKRPVL